MPDIVIATHELTKRFSDKTAVDGVSLSVPRGAVYAFLGPNGAGKSTSIRMLLGLLRPTSGTLTIFGHTLATHRSDILRRTGSLVENPSVYPHLTAQENLDIPRRLLGAATNDIDRVLAIVGLAYARHKLVRQFSLGMRQRLGLAAALLGTRELLILDEPTNGLDPAGINEMRELVRSLPVAHGITVMLSSHLLGEVEQVATDVGILSRGRLVFQGSVAEIGRRRHSQLRVRTANAAGAVAVLALKGLTATIDAADVILDATTDAAVVNRVLVESGHDVRHLAVESASLEDVFLTMTEAEVA